MKIALINAYLSVFGGYSYMNSRYNKDYDIVFSELLDKHDFIINSNFYATLGKDKFWIENRPYGCFYREVGSFKGDRLKIRPSRYNIWKAIKKLQAAIEKVQQSKIKQIVSEI